MIEAGPVEREEDLEQILDLQRANLARHLSAEEVAAEGFVTVEHKLDLLKRMHAIAPSPLAGERTGLCGEDVQRERVTSARSASVRAMYAP